MFVTCGRVDRIETERIIGTVSERWRIPDAMQPIGRIAYPGWVVYTHADGDARAPLRLIAIPTSHDLHDLEPKRILLVRWLVAAVYLSFWGGARAAPRSRPGAPRRTRLQVATGSYQLLGYAGIGSFATTTEHLPAMEDGRENGSGER